MGAGWLCPLVALKVSLASSLSLLYFALCSTAKLLFQDAGWVLSFYYSEAFRDSREHTESSPNSL